MEECLTCDREVCDDDKWICPECEVKMEAEDKKVKELLEAGHSSHCVARQIWGDGECECSELRRLAHEVRQTGDIESNAGEENPGSESQERSV